MSKPKILSPHEVANPASGHERRIHNLEAAYSVLINKMAQENANVVHQFNNLVALVDVICSVVGPQQIEAEAQSRNQKHLEKVAELAEPKPLVAP